MMSWGTDWQAERGEPAGNEEGSQDGLKAIFHHTSPASA